MRALDDYYDVMNDNMGHGLFPARDVERLLGISSKTLYHWVQTRRLITPAIIGKGRGSENKFDLDGLATLAFIKILASFGIELSAIKEITDRVINSDLEELRDDEVPSFEKYQELVKNYQITSAIFGGPNEQIYKKMNLWKLYRSKKDFLLENGFFYTISRSTIGIGFNDQDKAILTTAETVSGLIKGLKDLNVMNNYSSFVIINLLGIIREIEVKTGEKM